MCAAGIALFGAARARAQVTSVSAGAGLGGDTNWSASAARTVGAGAGVLQGEAGWPGVSFTYLYGADDRTDFGAKISFNYGFESTSSSLAGVALAVPYRRMLTNNDVFNFGLRAEPGAVVYNNGGSALVGIGGPIGLIAGYRVDPQLTLDAGADFPVLFSFTNPTGFLFGPLFGGGGEYHLERNLSLTAKVRVGPQFSLETGKGSNTGSQFGFQTLIGLAYNMR